MGTNKIIYLDKEFSATDVTSGNLYQARSPIAASQEIDTFSFDVDSEDTTLTEFIRNTPLTYFHNDEQMGIYYVQKVSRTSINTYHFACTSTVGLLDETYHDGGIYTGETVKEVCEDICSPLTVYVKTNLQNIKLYGWLPIATRRENLTQVLFAIGATFKVDFDGAIRIEGLWNGEASAIDAGEIYASGTVDYATPVTEVIVTEHAYSQSATETAELFKGTTSLGDKITFSEPCYDLVATGFSILASGANWATVSAGSGTLVGKKYTHVTRQVVEQIKPKTRDLVTQSDNTVKVENATLVSLVNATAVAERLAEYYSHNERINYKIATKREIPGDVVKIAHPYGGTVSGCIESSDITLSSKLASQESVLVGYKPPATEDIVTYEYREVITEDGIWNVPDNVHSVRAILIGGGDKGEDGNDGEDCWVTSRYTEAGFSFTTPTGSAGKGGSGGTGGAGGKIYDISFNVSPGESIKCVIGTGGTGASQPGDTVFGAFSSSSGNASDIGWTDVTTGETFALKGTDGIKGGDGGDVGSPGESVGDYSGGSNSRTKTGSIYFASSTKVGTYNASSGGGGGASADGRGGACNVGEAFGGAGQGSSDSVDHMGVEFFVYGGAGASGRSAPNAAVYGSGGTGGNGGGGAGAIAPVTANIDSTIVKKVQWNFLGGIARGGNGGTGGAGMHGCIVIFYGTQREIPHGRLLTKDHLGFNEKFTRKVVV
jgi:hypothetical protein